MLENKVATGLKVTAVLASLVVIHGVGSFLGNLFLVSDIFTVLGAITVYRFLTDGFVREEALESISDAIDLDETASYLVTNGIKLAGSLGVAAAESISAEDVLGQFFINEDEELELDLEEEDTLVQ